MSQSSLLQRISRKGPKLIRKQNAIVLREPCNARLPLYLIEGDVFIFLRHFSFLFIYFEFKLNLKTGLKLEFLIKI